MPSASAQTAFTTVTVFSEVCVTPPFCRPRFSFVYSPGLGTVETITVDTPQAAEHAVTVIAGATGGAPLSCAQQQLWFLDRLDPGGSTYNFDVVLRLYGELDVKALHSAFQRVVDRHDVLRTTFSEGPDGIPWQRVIPGFSLPLDAVHLTPLPPAASRTVADALVREWAAEPFDLAAGPLVRLRVIHVDEQEHVVGLFLHHAVCDGWSVDVIFRELAHYYTPEGEPAPLPEPAVRYADHARRQRDLPSDERQLNWWREYLDGAPTTLAMSGDRSARGAQVLCHLPASTVAGVAALARMLSTTTFAVQLAAYSLLLAHHIGSRELLVGTQVAGRPRLALYDTVGLFANTIPIRIDLSRPRDFRELVAHVRESTLDALTHDHVPFDRIVEAVRPERTAGRMPLVQTGFTAQTAPQSPPELTGLTVELVSVAPVTTKFDLSMSVTPRSDSDEHEVTLTYDTGVLGERDAGRLAGRYRELLSSALAAPESGMWRLLPQLPPAGGRRAAVTGRRGPALVPNLPSRAALEDLLADIWREVLKIDRITVHDNFFDVGGQSLTLAVVHARAEQALGQELPLVAFYEHPSIVALAAQLFGDRRNERRPTQRGGTRRARSRERRRAARERGN
ncbi:condensation domain-containing protein [Streptomyces sp. WMMC500]|nr:condensation domain-containing protein [Streptomyces sp. WMMC500]WBB62054.1 condensation domain-containing protein [Streptomyces sp. WMMC500]